VHPDDLEATEKRFRDRIQGTIEDLTSEFRVLRNDGEFRWLECFAHRIEFEGEPAVQATVLDITEKKRAEEELRRLEAQFQQTQKLESLGVLAGGIAHDFNNLLLGVLGNADLALMDLSPIHPARSSVEEIVKAARRAAELSRQMLAYSGKGKFVVANMDLSELVHEMGHLLESSISKNAHISYRLADRLPAVEGDITQIRQVVMNLIINASEALGDNPGIIRVTTDSMECSREYLSKTYLDECQPEGRYVYLEVSDSGCGMDRETLERIFDPFFTTKFMGRGLGLAALLGIVRGHQGAIVVESEPGQGTTLRILFPASKSVSPPAPPLEESPPVWSGSGVILLVDDERTVLRTGERMLERAGFTVLTAESGRAGLDLFEKQPDRIRCVILDLTMPDLDGEETFSRIRAIDRDVPVILSSGYSREDIESRFEKGDLAGFIQKPYQWEELLRRVAEAIGP
jgi:signal transduction histidine kinase/CheY-like chemotaxis protein